VRYVWTDGRAHTPADQLFDSLNGESIGHWEGETFVIDTIGLTTNEIVLGVPVPNMHVVERVRLTDPNSLEITSTISAPGALKAPWVYTRHYVRAQTPFGPGGGAGCNGDRSVDPRTGKQGFDLTPPKGGFVPPGATE
jgi:hypothetical protein